MGKGRNKKRRQERSRARREEKKASIESDPCKICGGDHVEGECEESAAWASSLREHFAQETP